MPIVFPTSPTVGQLFTEAGRSWVWSGSSWDAPTTNNALQIPFGMVHLKTVSFTGATGFNFGTNTFSSQFDNYKIVTNLTGNTSPVVIQFMTSGTANGTSNYGYAASGWGSNATSSTVNTGATSTTVIWTFYTRPEGSAATINVYNPNRVSNTILTGEALGVTVDAVAIAQSNFAGRFGLNTVFDDILLLAGSGTLTGEASIYGFRK
jgi:hypothetical protein